jgi:CxxC-x17-CxxC domain-containing protein
MTQRPMTEIKCDDCGTIATVPFKPTAGKPVYCRECLTKHRTKKTSASRDQNLNNDKQAWSRRREAWKS